MALPGYRLSYRPSIRLIPDRRRIGRRSQGSTNVPQPVRAPPIFAGSGGEFNAPVFWETFLLTLNLSLRHPGPVAVKTGDAEKGKGASAKPSCDRRGILGPEKAYGRASAHP